MDSLHDSFAANFAGPAMQSFHGVSGVVVEPPGSHPIELPSAIVHSQELFTDYDDAYEKSSEIHVLKIEFNRSDIDDSFLPLSNRTVVTVPEFPKYKFVVRAEESNLTSSLCTLVVERRTLQRRHELRRYGTSG